MLNTVKLSINGLARIVEFFNIDIQNQKLNDSFVMYNI